MALRTQPSEPDLRRATYVNLSHRNLDSKRLHHALQVTRRRIAYIHDDIPIRYPNLALKTLNRSFHEMFSQVLTTRFEIITNSLTSRRRIEETGKLFGYKFSNINVVAPPISEAFLPIKNIIPSARPFFVTTGLFTKRKNFQIIVEAVKRLSARSYPVPFDVVFVGAAGKDVADGFGDHLRSWGRIRLLHADALTDHGYRRLVRAARAVLAPSLDEGFDYPAHEARALGTSVLASDIEVHREGLSGDVTFIGSDDVDGWADAMANCVSQSRPPGMAAEQIHGPKPLGSWQASCEALLRIALEH
jgi:glycosyltransferase involved in cell wall biosynthesis